MTELKLNIGNGTTVIPGWTGVDVKDGGSAVPLRLNDGSQVPDCSVSEIRCSHALEHLSFGEAMEALKDWTRALVPGGRIRISVPDFERIVEAWNTDPKAPFYLLGGQMDEHDFHRSVFDENRLRVYLESVGLVNIQRWESKNTDLASHPISLNLEGFKPADDAPEAQTIKIKAVMSVPRIGWNDGSAAIEATLRPSGINVVRFNGVFWGQCMQRAFQECLAEGVDWILAIDYDSMPTPRALDALIGTFGSHPEIDALASLQMRRGNDFPLMTRAGETEIEITNQPIKVHTAHFGMTLIRTESLRDLPKPWFASKPDKNGEWEDERLDEDIWFWHQWRLAGKTIYVDPTARIGHLELVVSEYDEEMQPHHLPISDWWKKTRAMP